MHDLEYWKREVQYELRQHAKAINEIGKIVSGHQQSEMIAMQTRASEFLADMMQRQQHYASAITLIGYGGFFALWSTVSGRMPTWLFATCGILISVSLMIFVLWEIVKMHVLAAAAKEAMNPKSGARPLNPERAIEHILSRARTLDLKYYLPIFWSSTVTGFAAGMGLLAWFVVSLIGWL